MKTRNLIIATLLAGAVVLAGCNRDEPVDSTADLPATGALETPPAMTTTPETAATSVRVTSVQFGSEVGDDRTIAAPATTFPPDTETISVAITTTSDAAGETVGTLGARWTFQDGQLVEESSQTLAFSGQDVSNFHIKNPDAWPAGNYTVEITLDGEVVETARFTIQ